MKFAINGRRATSSHASIQLLNMDRTKPLSRQQYRCSSLYNQCVRFLLKTESGWLADHSFVSDGSDPFTDNSAIALQFVTPEGAAERARALLHLFPDLEVEAVDVPMPSRTRGRTSVPSVHG